MSLIEVYQRELKNKDFIAKEFMEKMRKSFPQTTLWKQESYSQSYLPCNIEVKDK